MNQLSNKNYQTYFLFFSWTIGLFSMAVTMFFHIEVELTPIILAILAIDILFNLKKTPFKNFSILFYRFFILLFIFYGWLIFSNAYSPSLEYKFEKSFKFIINIIFFVYPFFVRKINFNLLIRLYVIFVLPISAYFIYLLSIVWIINTKQTQNFLDIRSSYLSIGIHLGILFLLLLFYKKNIVLKVLTFFLLVASSARGPLLFTIITSIVYLYSKDLKQFFKGSNIFKIVGVGVGLTIFYLYKPNLINSLLANTILRFTSLGSGVDKSSMERIERLEMAFYSPFEKISTFIFGHGVGSFGVLFDKIDQKSYPHNIFLESFFELGIIGLILFAMLFLIVFSKLSIKSNVFSLLFLFMFLNAMKSSSIIDLWLLFSFMGGVILMYKTKNTVEI